MIRVRVNVTRVRQRRVVQVDAQLAVLVPLVAEGVLDLLRVKVRIRVRVRLRVRVRIPSSGSGSG